MSALVIEGVSRRCGGDRGSAGGAAYPAGSVRCSGAGTAEAVDVAFGLLDEHEVVVADLVAAYH